MKNRVINLIKYKKYYKKIHYINKYSYKKQKMSICYDNLNNIVYN